MSDEINKIPTTTLGANGPLVGIQGLGCMGMSEFYGVSDDAQSLATLNRAIDLGATMIDTADMYGMGRNEALIGSVIRARRDEVLIATKFGFTRGPDTPDDYSISNHPDHIAKAVDGSLKRLGIDVIDLYYMHRRDPSVPLADSIGAMSELVRAGKIRYLGVSEFSAGELHEASAIHPIAALQTEWSVFSRDVEDTIVPAASALGIAFVAYSPLGRGMLTNVATPGGAGDIRNWLPRFAGENGEKNARLALELTAIAEKRGITAAQLALAWLQKRADVHGLSVIPIPGTRKVARLEENLSATSIILTQDELAKLEPLAASVQGERV